MQYASLGNIVFQAQEWNSHSEDNTYVWAKHDTANAPGLQQFMGTELRTIPVQLQWHSAWCDPQTQYEALKAAASEGEPLKLIIADDVIGDFIIQKISGDVIQKNQAGTSIFISCKVELTEYAYKTLTRHTKAKSRPAVKSSATKSATPQYKATPVAASGTTPSYRKIEKVN